MAQVVVFDEIGGPEVLKIVDRPVTEPAANDVRIKVEAIGVNRADQMLRSGVYAFLPQLPGSRLGVEAAGVVDAVGDKVTTLTVGDEVLVTAVPRMDADGVYGQYVNLPADTVIHRPGDLDAVDAAALWVVYASAYGALVEKAHTRAGDHVLITAASSAVGMAAIQTANRIGAIPIATTRRADKKEALLKAGARHVIVTAEQDVAPAAHDLTDGAGVDVILDAVAGPGLPELAKAAKPGGTIVVIGWLDTRPALLPMNWPLTIIGYSSYEHTLDKHAATRVAAFLDSGLRAGTLSPTISKVFALDDVVGAHRYLESGGQLGKVVVTV
jgi:NADPH:quinone reductase-like Zn-dependent oxidoreductase